MKDYGFSSSARKIESYSSKISFQRRIKHCSQSRKLRNFQRPTLHERRVIFQMLKESGVKLDLCFLVRFVCSLQSIESLWCPLVKDLMHDRGANFLRIEFPCQYRTIFVFWFLDFFDGFFSFLSKRKSYMERKNHWKWNINSFLKPTYPRSNGTGLFKLIPSSAFFAA